MSPPGDPVVLNWAPSCGACSRLRARRGLALRQRRSTAPPASTPVRADGTELHPGLNVAAFAEETVVAANCVLPLPDGVPLDRRGPAGLRGPHRLRRGPPLGPGARRRDASPSSGSAGSAWPSSRRPGSPGPSTIIAVDVSPEKEELARAAGRHRLRRRLRHHRQARSASSPAGSGADVAVECVGRRRHHPRRLGVDPARRPHHGRRHRRQGPAGHLQRPGDLPLGPHPHRLRLRQQRPGPRPAGARRAHPGRPARPRPRWSPSGSPSTASRPPSTTCSRAGAAGRWWCSDAGSGAPGRARAPRPSPGRRRTPRERATATPARHSRRRQRERPRHLAQRQPGHQHDQRGHRVRGRAHRGWRVVRARA